jgi:exodeoxyribonuclease VII large subunit
MDKNPWLSVSELTHQLKQILENSFPQVFVEAEVSNCRPSSAGHIYFSLKDNGALISAVLFRGSAQRVKVLPEDGKKIRVRGRISLYEPRGSYQIIVDYVEEAGIGDILKQLEERKQKLAAEGLFESSRKKPLPPFPGTVAVITSPSGAAIRDVLRVLKRRNAGINIRVLPASVQGDSAASEVVKQLEYANRWDLGEIVLITRGGGSLEDLLPFSDEALVRAVAESKNPVMSAIGHEIDTSIIDYAADMRAATPSQAAELISSDKTELLIRIQNHRQQISTSIRSQIEAKKLLASRFSGEELERQFRNLIQPFYQKLDDAKERMIDRFMMQVERRRQQITHLCQQIQDRSPMGILEQGYALVRSSEGLIRSSSQGEPGEQVQLHFFDGKREAELGDRASENEQT